MTNDNDAKISPDAACPVCGERDTDRLVWIDDDIVCCTMCGTEYDPSKPRNGGSHVEP